MMESNKRNIDEFFQEELGGLTEMPPSSIWDTLEKRLDDNKPRSKKIAWWFLPLIAIVFIGATIAAYVAMNHNTTASNTAPSISANDFTKINSTKPQSNTTIDHSSNTPLTEENESAKNEIKSPATDNKQSNRNKENNIATNNNPTKNAPDQSNESAALNESKPKTGSSLEKVLNNQDVAATPSNKERLKKSLDNNTQQKSKDNQLANTSNNANNPATAKENIAPESAKSNSVKTKKESLQEETSNAALANKVVPNANSQTASKTSKAKGSAKGALNSSPATTEKASNATASSATATKEELNSSAKTIKKRLEANTAAVKEASQSNSITTAKKPIASNSVIADNAVQASKNTTNTNNNTTLAAQSDQKDRKDKASNQEAVVQKTLAKTSQNQPPLSKEEKPQSKNQIQANPAEQKKTNQAEQEDTAEADEETSESGGGVSAATKKPKQKRPLNMLLGLKGGYERGFENYTASKYVGNLFAEVTFSRKVSFLFQPGIKFAQTNQEYTVGSNGYFKVNSNGVNQYNVRKDTIGKPIGYDYAYTQSYDSIIALQQAKRSYMEIELPFLFRFKLDQHFSILGGMNFTFGKILTFTNSLNTIAGLKLYDTILNFRDSIAPSAPAKFSHPGSTPFSSYKEDNAAAISPIRFGYIFGISYQIKERLMLDLLVQQNLSKLNSIQDDGIRKLYTQPYVRFSIGYNLFGVKKK